MDLSEVLLYGPDYLARTRETTSNLFLLNVIDSIYMLQTSDFCKDIDVILTTLIWYSNTIQLHLNTKNGMIKPSWWWQIHWLNLINSHYNIDMNKN